MTYGATFLKGNYQLPRGPVKLSRERWELLTRGQAMQTQTSVLLIEPQETDGVIFLPAEYVPEQVAQ